MTDRHHISSLSPHEQIIAQSHAVRLRPTTEDDLDFVLATERTEENIPFVGQWPRHQHREVLSNDDVAHLVVETASDGRRVGYLILTGLAGADRSVKLQRITIAEKSKGFGRDALRLVKELVFGQFGAHRLWLDVRDSNERARRLYESEGFVFEGTLRESSRVGDQIVRLQVLSILSTNTSRDA
jgi:ribosomal protein S18 acetylase RimI-like enzyme